MYCPSCYKTVNSTSSKCPGCGTPVGEKQAPAAAPAAPGQGRSGGAAPATRPYRRLAAGVGLFSLAAVLGAGAVTWHGAHKAPRHHGRHAAAVASTDPASEGGE